MLVGNRQVPGHVTWAFPSMSFRALPAPSRSLHRPAVQTKLRRSTACISIAATGNAAYTTDTGLQHSQAAVGLQVGIRPAVIQDYWAIAEVHSQSFYPSANRFFAPWLRLDRVLALKVGTDNEHTGKQGKFSCFVAYDLSAVSSGDLTAQTHDRPGAHVPPFFKFLLAESLQAGFEVSPDSIGLLGAVIVDMQASFLPSERVEKGPFVAYERPRDVAYISNLAVLPRARRQGVGEQLLLAAEKAAREWGCTRLALHCDANNAAAAGLYRKHHYAVVSTEHLWGSFLQGRQVQLQLMARNVS